MFYDGLPSKFVCAGAGPPLGFHVGHRAGLIQVVDAIGGDRGVNVQGVLGVQGFMVTPHGSGMIGQLIEGVNHWVAWIVDFLLLTAQKVPTVAEGLGIGTAAAVLGAVVPGNRPTSRERQRRWNELNWLRRCPTVPIRSERPRPNRKLCASYATSAADEGNTGLTGC